MVCCNRTLQSWKLWAKSTGGLNRCSSFFFLMSKACCSSGLENYFLYFSPWKHQVGHIPGLTTLKSSQVCSQQRLLKGGTAPEMFTTLRLSPVFIISPLRGGQRSLKMLLLPSKSYSAGWCPLSAHYHICELSALVVPCWQSRPCSRCLDICCLLCSSLSNLPSSYGANEELQYLLQIKQWRGDRKYFHSSWSLVMDSRVYWRTLNVNCAHGPNEHICSPFL